MSDELSVLYLHGFASGPQSRKATFFREKLTEAGYRVTIPDLAQGNFRELTITRQLGVIEKAAGEATILIGSSLGGYLAALYAAQHTEIERLVLLAPAFGFRQLWEAELGPERLLRWKEAGEMPVFHYGAGQDMPLGYKFLEDARHYAAFPDFRQPALLFHGDLDATVPVAQSLEFVQHHSNARLIRLASGHELTDVLESIWEGTENFLSDTNKTAQLR